MVFKRRTEYGFLGYDTPVIPRGRRSIRKKGSSKKTLDDEGQLCAFELLATLAGKLLQETETTSSASSSAAMGLDHLGKHKDPFVKEEVEGPSRLVHDDQGSSEESVVSSGLRSLKCSDKNVNQMVMKNSNFDASTCSEKMSSSDEKPANLKSDQLPSEIDGGSPKCGESHGAKNVDNRITMVMEECNGGLDDDAIASANKLGLGDKSPPQISSTDEGNITLEHLSFGRGSLVPDAAFVRHGNDIKIGSSSSNDKKFFYQCSDPSSSHIKLTSKYWRSGPKLQDCKVTNSGSKVNNIYQSRKSCHSTERFRQHDAPFKKRKLFGQSSVVTQDRGLSSESESVSNSTRTGVSDNKSSSHVLTPHKDNGVSSSTMDRQRSFTSRNSHVKLSIKSFKVPELLIEVPESTTVGSLKKSVLEAVTRVFGGGLRVGLLLNGRRIGEDGKTLLETGLSEEDSLDNLGFLLEPNNLSALASPILSPQGSPILSTGDSPKDFVNRAHLTPKVESNLIDMLDKKTSVIDVGKIAGYSRDDLVPLMPPKSENKHVSDSRALVVVPENVDALAVLPTGQRPRRSEIGQRRTRRPFSVSEVEALVQAVEKLGTGRWRDVKLCAFENAKHRTYVDLKDKWKTLVHTARISPQQRRGEPVPQELLDRVLAAHAYWSQHQAKQHGKQQLQPHQQAPIQIEKVAA